MSLYLTPTRAQIEVAQEHPLVEWMVKHLVHLNDYVLMGSMVLYFFGIRRPTDVDVLVNPREWEYLEQTGLGQTFTPISGQGEGILIQDEAKRMELFSVWQFVDNRELLSQAIPVETRWGVIRLAPIELVYAYKIKAVFLPDGVKHWLDCTQIALYFDAVGKKLPLIV